MSSLVDRDILFQRCVDLIVKQSEYVEQWSSRLVTAQAGMAAAAGVVVAWQGLPLGHLVSLVVVLLALLAISFALVARGILGRHMAWQGALIESAKAIEHDPMVYRDSMLVTKAPGVRRLLDLLTIALCSGWLVVAILAGVQFVQAK